MRVIKVARSVERVNQATKRSIKKKQELRTKNDESLHTHSYTQKKNQKKKKNQNQKILFFSSSTHEKIGKIRKICKVG